MAWTKPQEMVQLGRISLVSIFPGSEKSREEGKPLYQKRMWGQRDGSQVRAAETSQTQAVTVAPGPGGQERLLATFTPLKRPQTPIAHLLEKAQHAEQMKERI